MPRRTSSAWRRGSKLLETSSLDYFCCPRGSSEDWELNLPFFVATVMGVSGVTGAYRGFWEALFPPFLFRRRPLTIEDEPVWDWQRVSSEEPGVVGTLLSSTEESSLPIDSLGFFCILIWVEEPPNWRLTVEFVLLMRRFCPAAGLMFYDFPDRFKKFLGAYCSGGLCIARELL
jgi:hypothetical protein